jgi:hypothetical protein
MAALFQSSIGLKGERGRGILNAEGAKDSQKTQKNTKNKNKMNGDFIDILQDAL